MDGRNGESIRSPHDMFGRFTAERTPQIQPWQQSLLEQPGDLESVEKTVHQAFARGADMMVAGLIAGTIASESL